MGSGPPAPAEEIERISLDLVSGLLLDLAEELGGEKHLKVLNVPGVEAGDVAMGLSPVTIKTPAGPIQALDHTSGLQGFKILINGSVTNVATKVIELFKNITGAEVSFFRPQQL
jgi:hypothetical protein